MASSASAAAVVPGAAALDRIFSETTTVAIELGEMAQKIIESEAAAAPREESWFTGPDLDALKELASHTLFLFDDDSLRAAAGAETVLQPTPDGAAVNLTFVPNPTGAGASNAIVLADAATRIKGAMRGVAEPGAQLGVVGGGAAKLRLPAALDGSIEKICLSIPGVIDDENISTDQLASWLGRPWERPVRVVRETDTVRLTALQRARGAQKVQLPRDGAAARALAALSGGGLDLVHARGGKPGGRTGRVRGGLMRVREGAAGGAVAGLAAGAPGRPGPPPAQRSLPRGCARARVRVTRGCAGQQAGHDLAECAGPTGARAGGHRGAVFA